MTRVSREEFNRIARLQREKAAARKARREEKRAGLPWGKEKVLWVGSPPCQPFAPKRRRAPSPRQLLRAKLDSLWAFLVKLRDRLAFGGLCRICGRRAIEVAYHLIPRGDDATRWEPENGVGACAPCNRGEQLNRSRYRAKHVRLFGKELIERLEEKARTRAMFTMADLEGIREKLTSMIVALGGNR